VRAKEALIADHDRLVSALLGLSDRHAATVMLARTLLQPAPPITFGLKAAGWLGAVRRSGARLAASFDEACLLQFGGASGTLARSAARSGDRRRARRRGRQRIRARRGTHIATGWRRSRPPAGSTPACSARSRATSRS
jgi:3-carboxy-cis,cis-muconate cycloisomerase